jgi:hypothetical protein
VKDLRTRCLISRCNSTGSLYPLLPPASPTTPSVLLASASSQLWPPRRACGHGAVADGGRSPGHVWIVPVHGL